VPPKPTVVGRRGAIKHTSTFIIGIGVFVGVALGVSGSLTSAQDGFPIAYWTFDESSGTVAHDATGDNDGTRIGN
jgi:hypothetical protein